MGSKDISTTPEQKTLKFAVADSLRLSYATARPKASSPGIYALEAHFDRRIDALFSKRFRPEFSCGRHPGRCDSQNLAGALRIYLAPEARITLPGFAHLSGSQ